jgi:hypothetical protein
VETLSEDGVFFWCSILFSEIRLSGSKEIQAYTSKIIYWNDIIFVVLFNMSILGGKGRCGRIMEKVLIQLQIVDDGKPGTTFMALVPYAVKGDETV